MHLLNANFKENRIITALFLLLVLGQSKFTLAYCPELTEDFVEADRITALNELLDQDLKLLNSIPRLSPREEDWLEKELSSGAGTRYIAASESREYAVQQAVERISFRVNHIQEIIAHEVEGPISLNYNLERYRNLVWQLQNNAKYIGDNLIALTEHEVVIADPLQYKQARLRRVLYQISCEKIARSILWDVLRPALQQLPE